MKLFILLCLGLNLAILIYEDFMQRKISLIWLLTLAACSLWYNFIHNIPLPTALSYIGINTLIILFNLVFISIYFSVKSRRMVDITKEHLGAGDILFFIAAACLFSPLNFLVFLLMSLFFSLIVTLIFAKGTFRNSIPLMGLQGIYLLLTLFAGVTMQVDFIHGNLLQQFSIQ